MAELRIEQQGLAFRYLGCGISRQQVGGRAVALHPGEAPVPPRQPGEWLIEFPQHILADQFPIVIARIGMLVQPRHQRLDVVAEAGKKGLAETGRPQALGLHFPGVAEKRGPPFTGEGRGQRGSHACRVAFQGARIQVVENQAIGGRFP